MSEEIDYTQVAYCIPRQKFYYRDHTGRFDLGNPVGEDGIEAHLKYYGVDPDTIKAYVNFQGITLIHGFDMQPNEPELFYRGTQTYVNTWVKPLVEPVQGDWPTIRWVMEHLTRNDPMGLDWVLNWIAAKVQDPLLVPKIALVFLTPPGGGKGTFAYILRALLGFHNTARITAGDLENKFNSRWVEKLLIFADEVVDKDSSQKDITQKLKILIDADQVQHEGKGDNQRDVPNRAAWVFASNDVIPLVIEQMDRRYTVFDNLAPVSQEHKDRLRNCFVQKGNRTEAEPFFFAELQGFMYDMKARKVDMNQLAVPYENEARHQLMQAAKPAHVQFVEEVAAHGIYELIEQADRADVQYPLPDKTLWDFGEEGIASWKVYAAYRAFCKRVGMQPMRDNRFGAEIRRYWQKSRRRIPGNKQVYIYIIPGTQGSGTVAPAASGPTQPKAEA